MTVSSIPARPWETVLARAKAVTKEEGIPDPARLQQHETLPAAKAAPLTRAVLVVPARLEPGPAIAANDLQAYLEEVTGKPVQRIVAGPHMQLPPGATVFAVGDVPGLAPRTGQKEGYAIHAGPQTLGGQRVNVVGVGGGDGFGLQHGVYRLMELTGKRFFSYTDSYTPPVGQAKAPANGFDERHAPASWMGTRGFAPHLYHPIPLSFAFHEPSAEHLAMMKHYIDWHVQNGQNTILFPMLELDQGSAVIPFRKGHAKFDAWVPYARQMVDYAHQRGVKMSCKLAFANYVSSNAFAINPLQATYQSMRLGYVRKHHPDQYPALLAKYRETDRKKIEAAIDKYMQVPWDEITWNLGTSEFTPTNDDLTIAWMDDAAAYIKKKYPGVTTAARSHVPVKPWSEKYDDSYFNLMRFADPAMGVYVHTTEAYSLTDKAPVYGNEDFTHKLKMLSRATPERKDVFYPETSYWVAHDVSVPLFLPVYMLNRKQDVDILKTMPNLDGQMGFTTAWEWGYWLNDYALARMQDHPEESLTEILDGALTPLGQAKTPMVRLMNEAMLFQQHYLFDKNLIRHLQGFDNLTDFGRKASQNPVLSKVLDGTNSTPVRLPMSEVMTWDEAKLAAYEQGDLHDLAVTATTFASYADRSDKLRAKVPAAAARLQDELADGFRINALRARQVLELQEATVAARRAQLAGGNKALQAQALAHLTAARETSRQAMAAIADREKDYREGPAYNTDKGGSLTLWKDRSLTPVHTAEYWRNSYDEVAKLLKQPKL